MAASFQRAIVVGASSGIGEAIARQLAAQGCHVALIARREEHLKTLVEELEQAGGRAAALTHDVTHFDEAGQVFDQAVERLGGLDLLVYAAGVMPSIEEHEYAFHKDRAMVETNLLGAMAWLNPAAAHMEAQRSGVILGISSIAGERGRRGNPAYCTSKAAMTTYLESLRNRLTRYGVRVVTIKPGFVRTAMTEGMGDLLWIISADEAARQSLNHARGSTGAHFVPARWSLVALVIRWIPSWVFRKLNI